MFCPKCGTENPDGVRLCKSCSWVLPAMSTQTSIRSEKTSGWAIAAIICGILTPFSCGISAILAITFGIVALVKISKSRGIVKGSGLAIAGIAIPLVWLPLIVLLMGILMPALARVRFQAQRVVCATNMKNLGFSLMMYANDNACSYPSADKWCDILMEYTDVSKTNFRCRSTSEGPCNFALNKNIEKLGTKAPPDMVLVFETSPGWNQSGGPEILSTENHKGEGCNILFNDGRVEFIKTEDLDRLLWDVNDTLTIQYISAGPYEISG